MDPRPTSFMVEKLYTWGSTVKMAPGVVGLLVMSEMGQHLNPISPWGSGGGPPGIRLEKSSGLSWRSRVQSLWRNLSQLHRAPRAHSQCRAVIPSVQGSRCEEPWAMSVSPKASVPQNTGITDRIRREWRRSQTPVWAASHNCRQMLVSAECVSSLYRITHESLPLDVVSFGVNFFPG